MLTVIAFTLLLQDPLLDEVPLDPVDALHSPFPRPQDPVPPDLPPLERITSWKVDWFPDELLYRNYLADPQTPRSGSKFTFPVGSKGGHVKIESALGSQRPLWRAMDASGIEGVDISVEGAVVTRFDMGEDWDMEAADYRFGFPLGYRWGPIAAKFHVWHMSSHLGDEIISRTGAKALRYHENELAIGFAYDWLHNIRTYVDAGYGLYVGSAPDGRGRVETGVEWVGPGLWSSGPPTFLAADIKWRQETGWDTALNLQAGFYMSETSARAVQGMRLLLEYYRGYSPQTQFPDQREHYVAFGVSTGF